jgi:hypothetical protein
VKFTRQIFNHLMGDAQAQDDDYVMQWEGRDRFFHKRCAEMLLDELATERAQRESAR